MTDWLHIRRGSAPLIVSFPHTGTDIPENLGPRLQSVWLARQDTDWWVHQLYEEIARALQATTVRTAISRTVIDVNRAPDGASLYPSRVTTELCPLTTFAGESLYRAGFEPAAEEIAARRDRYFVPYHAALATEIERLRHQHGRVVLYDAHSIRSRIPRLFEDELPHLNIGTHDDAACDLTLTRAVERACQDPRFSRVTNGRFRGGWTIRHYGRPKQSVHALQMELACRGYLDEPREITLENWPVPYDPGRAAPLRSLLARVLETCLQFASAGGSNREASGAHWRDS
jgi:N-formylglutamate deformylase